MTYKKYYWLNDKSREFLSRGYVREGQTAEQRVREIAEAAEKYLGVEGYADKFEDYMSRGWFSLSSPVWANYGLERGLPCSCNGSYIEDTMDSILTKVGELGTMDKHGAGTSAFFGSLRERGAAISSGGSSNGPVHFMELFDKVTSVISQSNVRRGSMAAYLPVDHPDILEFLKIRSEGNPIQDLSIGVCISDEWMEGLLNKDKEKLKIWGEIIKKRFESGYPYVFFTGTANKNAPKVYRDKGIKIHASNLCVSPETRILTKNGHQTISELENQWVDIWNGKQWSNVKVCKTGENKEIYSVRIIAFIKKDGKIIGDDRCLGLNATEHHKFYLENGKEVCLSELKSGDKLLPCDMPNGYTFGYQVFDVKKQSYLSDTFCVNEPLEHKAVFNEILTGNCNEISLSSSQDSSFVCVLSSINLLHWDELKDTDAIETMTYFLDSVTEEYIKKTNGVKFMEAPNKFAREQRAVGLGVLGWHSYLQSKMIPFESMEAKTLNSQIFSTLNRKSLAASKEMAAKYGEPELLKGYGERQVTRLAVAPTTSSSFILGQVSQGIEPQNSNYYVKKLAKGAFTYKNPYLKELLKSKDQDSQETWKSILERGGSVQHLNFFSQEEKNVFKTFGEISQKEVVIQASARQKHLDQSQSLNLMIPPETTIKEVSQLMIFGWQQGIKGYYYQKSSNPSQMLARNILECSSCGA